MENWNLVPDMSRVDEIIDSFDKAKIPYTGPASLGELEAEVELLENIVNTLEDEEKALQKEIAEKQEVDKRLKEHLKSLKKLKKSRQKEEGKLKAVNEALQKDPLTEDDIHTLNKCERKFNLYRKCTGVVFDYPITDSVKGLISNGVTRKLHTFTIKENVTESLWNEMVKVSSITCSKHSQSQ